MATAIMDLIKTYPGLFTFLVVFLVVSFVYVIKNFKVTFKKGKPVFESRKDLTLQKEISELKAQIQELTEKLNLVHAPDFMKKTANGEYIGYSIAMSPYVEIWCDGNWNSEEHHDEFVRLGLLWTNETSVMIYGKNPNLPSKLWGIIETKAKNLDKKMEENPGCDKEHFTLSIHCHKDVEDTFRRFFKDFANVKILPR